MKRFLILLAVLSLNGCALYDAFMMTPFDPSEYRIITEIRTDANQYKAFCSDYETSKRNAIAIANKTKMFELYSQHIPSNQDSYKASKNLNAIAEGMVARYTATNKVSEVFCKMKFESIEHSAETMQHVLGKRPR